MAAVTQVPAGAVGPPLRERVGDAALTARRFLTSLRPAKGAGFLRFLLFTLVLLSAGMVWSVRYVYEPTTTGTSVSLDQLVHLGASSQVIGATFLDEDSAVQGTFCSEPTVAGHCSARVRSFWSRYPHSDAATLDLIQRLSDHATVTVDPQSQKALVRFVSTFVLPILILANVFGVILLARGQQGSIGDLMGFSGIGKKRSRRMRLSTGVTFDDVAGADEAVAELREVRDYLLDPRRYRNVGAAPPKGVLLFGPPGCGKTLLARAVAGESGVPFFSISGSEFVESLVGVGAARVRDLFRKAAQVAPAIIFIDELDAAGRRRAAGGFGGGSDEREQTLNQILVAMDGFEVSTGIVVIGATNRPDILDPALLRPGRFDRHVTVDQPDIEGRAAILRLHSRGKPMAAAVNLDELARRTAGFTGADLANVVNEAALLSIREQASEVSVGHLTEAVQRVLHGPRRRGRLMTDAERDRIAFHESGHTVVAAALGRLTELHRVSIVARGRGLGQALTVADADRLVRTRSELEDEIAIVLAGRAAEELCCAEPSTAAEADVERATTLARDLLGRHGMSQRFGPVRLLAQDGAGYLGAETLPGEMVSQQTLYEVDQEVSATVAGARDRALVVLRKHRRVLGDLATALKDAEAIEGRELMARMSRVLPRVEAGA